MSSKHSNKSDLKQTFNKFWDIYPNKHNKLAAQQIWYKMNPSGVFLDIIMNGLDAHIEHGCLRSVTYSPLAINWLKNQRWMDELPPTKASLLREFQSTPREFIESRNKAIMKCVNKGWGTVPTAREEALADFRVPEPENVEVVSV